MQRAYWSKWEKLLTQWGLKPLVCELLSCASPLFQLTAQMMVLGLPMFKGIPFGRQYTALLNVLEDDESIRQFSDYLRGVGV